MNQDHVFIAVLWLPTARVLLVLHIVWTQDHLVEVFKNSLQDEGLFY